MAMETKLSQYFSTNYIAICPFFLYQKNKARLQCLYKSWQRFVRTLDTWVSALFVALATEKKPKVDDDEFFTSSPPLLYKFPEGSCRLPEDWLCEDSEGLEVHPCNEGLTEVHLQPLHERRLWTHHHQQQEHGYLMPYILLPWLPYVTLYHTICSV